MYFTKSGQAATRPCEIKAACPLTTQLRSFQHPGILDCMTIIAKAMLVVFIGAWLVGVAAWFYGTRFFLPMWANGFRKTDKRRAYIRKALKGYGVFLLALGLGFTAGWIAEYWGGGW